MRWKNLQKLLKVISLLSTPQGATIELLQNELGMDRRSVYRMFEDIEELGFPLYDEQELGERRKTWHLDSSYVKKLPNIAIPDIKLDLGELLVLCMAASQTNIFKGTDFDDALRSSFHKLGLCLPDGLLAKLSRFQVLFQSSTKQLKDYTGKEAVISKMADAMLNQITCTVKYFSFSQKKSKEYSIDPLCFVNHNGGLYAYVRSVSHGDIIVLAIERIKSLKVSDIKFTYPENFIPQDYLDNCFGIMTGELQNISIFFATKIAPYIKERRWAKEQQLIEHSDDSIILNIQAPISWEIVSWILSFGPNAKVLSPDSLVYEVKNAVTQVHDQYMN